MEYVHQVKLEFIEQPNLFLINQLSSSTIAVIDQLRAENQAFRAEVARLKGQPPRPRFPDPLTTPDPSSENERKKHGPRGPFFVHTLRAELRRGRVGVVAVGDVPVAARRGAAQGQQGGGAGRLPRANRRPRGEDVAAPQFRGITKDHGLCWVHWGRNLKEPGHRGSAPRPGSPCP